MNLKKIIIASDHRGFQLKKAIIAHLKSKNYTLSDLGTDSHEHPVDYPDFAQKTANHLISSNELSMGILICNSGIGMSIAANRFKDVRAAVCSDVKTAILARKHNNSNILVLGASNLAIKDSINIVDHFLSTSFAEGRHQIRVEKIDRNKTELES